MGNAFQKRAEAKAQTRAGCAQRPGSASDRVTKNEGQSRRSDTRPIRRLGRCVCAWSFRKIRLSPRIKSRAGLFQIALRKGTLNQIQQVITKAKQPGGGAGPDEMIINVCRAISRRATTICGRTFHMKTIVHQASAIIRRA
jgi:hypothetical protein